MLSSSLANIIVNDLVQNFIEKPTQSQLILMNKPGCFN